jgi:hypothetical protein
MNDLGNVSVELLQNGLAISADPEMFALVAAQRHRVNKVVKKFHRRYVACRVHIVLDARTATPVSKVVL